MKKTLLAAVPLALLALAAPAAAQGGKHASTLKAKFAPSAESSVRGDASLVDGKRRDRFRLRVKGLDAGATYTWSLRQAAAGGDACTGETVGSFRSTSLEGRRRGSKVRSRSKGFAAAEGFSYAVVITDEAGEDVACAELRTKAQRKAERKASKRKGSKQEQSGGDDEQGDEDEQGDDDQSGDDSAEDESADDESDDDPSEDEGEDD